MKTQVSRALKRFGFHEKLTSALFYSYAMQKLVILVVSGESESDVVRASAGAVLARVLVQNSPFFAKLTSHPSLALALALKQTVVVADQSALFVFIDAWLDKVGGNYPVDMYLPTDFKCLMWGPSFVFQF